MENDKHTYTKEEKAAYQLKRKAVKKAVYEIKKSKLIRLSLSEAPEAKEEVTSEAEKAIERLKIIVKNLEIIDKRFNMLLLIDARYEIQLQETAIRNQKVRASSILPEKETISVKSATQSKPSTPTFTDNIFAGVLNNISYNRQTIATYFTDEQAAVICGKMSDFYARHIAAKYLQLRNQVQGAVYRFQIHYLANKALAFYGGPVLTFLLGLRPLKFNDRSAYAVKFQKLSTDISVTDIDFPALTFTTLKGDKYTLAFHLSSEFPAKASKRPVKIFKKGIQVGSIDTKGFVLDAQGYFLKKLDATSPSLLTFCSFLASSKSPAFYSGVETGNCFVCNRQLTDPISIRYGIGPVCLGRAIS